MCAFFSELTLRDKFEKGFQCSDFDLILAKIIGKFGGSPEAALLLLRPEAALPLLRESESAGGRACVRHSYVDVPPHANLYLLPY